MRFKVIAKLGPAIENNTGNLMRRALVIKTKKVMRLEKSATHNRNQAVEIK